MKSRLTIMLILIVAVVLIAACGGGGADSPTPTATQSQPTATPTSSAPAGGDAAAGETKYVSSCSGCHGADATGITGLGKSLVNSDFISSNSDQELLSFIKQGRPASDPANTTGIDMPPKGGNPALSDEDILDIIAYVRSLP